MVDPWHMRVIDYSIVVNRKRLDVDLFEVIQWTKKNCPHYICNQYHGGHYGNDLIDFLFLDQPDVRNEMNWFILRWS